jgi:hypothetical protein
LYGQEPPDPSPNIEGREENMQRKSCPVGILVAASSMIMTLLVPNIAHAQNRPKSAEIDGTTEVHDY